MDKIISQIVEELKIGRSVLLDCDVLPRPILGKICEATKKENIVRFEGEEKGLFHKITYTPPYKEFSEIKKLIMNVNSIKGMRKDFSGIIMLDITEMIGHEEDDHFIVLLKFLFDKNNKWKYIFVIDNLTDENRKLRLYKKILGVLRCALIKQYIEHDLILSVMEEVSENESIVISDEARVLFCEHFVKCHSGLQQIENTILDVCALLNTKNIGRKELEAYFECPSCLYMSN